MSWLDVRSVQPNCSFSCQTLFSDKGKSDEYKEKSERDLRKVRDEDAAPRDASSDRDTKRHKKKSKKHKRGSDDDADDVTPARSSAKSSSRKTDAKTRDASRRDVEQWLRTHLRVRIIDKRLKEGRYYKTKVRIETSVWRLALRSCLCE